MALDITGNIIQILPLQTGTSSRGEWKKQYYILETEGQYPKKVCFNAWGDKIDTFSIKEGEKVTVSIEIESREFNSRWYTDISAWRVERVAAGSAVHSAPIDTPPPPISDEKSDLPF